MTTQTYLLLTMAGLHQVAADEQWPDTIVLHKDDWKDLLRRDPVVTYDASGPFVLLGITKFRPTEPRIVDLSGAQIFRGGYQ